MQARKTQGKEWHIGSIFVSYRREDSAPYAGRLYDRLSAYFGEDQANTFTGMSRSLSRS